MYFRPGVTKQKPLNKKNQELHTYSGSLFCTFSVELKFEAILLWGERNDLLQGEKLLRKDKKQPLQTQCTCEKGISNHTQAIEKEGKFPTASS